MYNSSANTVNQVLDVFQGFRMEPTPVDQYEAIGKQLLTEKFSNFVEHNKPIDFVMLGYPMKSSNERDKVLGKLPDMAEKVSLTNFANFNSQVKQVYEPGVNIHIVNDGYVFNDLLGIDDKTVRQYGEITTEMGREAPMQWYNLGDFVNTGTMADKREVLMENFGINEMELERRILMDPDINFLYRGMIHFMEEELAPRNFPSRNQLNKEAKRLARQMMMRNEAYSNFVKANFSSFVRLSMHPSTNSGAKYSFKLIPGQNTHHSPWHGALLVNKDGQFETIHKQDAELAGHELVLQDGQPYYFKQN